MSIFKKLSIAGGIVFLLAGFARADLVVDFTDNDSATDYGSVFFSSVAVDAGDFLVIAHSNNKRDNGNNDITISGAGANTFSTLNAGDTGSGQGAWLFYSQISASGTFDLTLDTSNLTKTVSQASSVWVISADSGEVVSLAGTDTNVATDATSLDLEFSFSSSLTNGMGFGAGTTGDALSIPGGWTSPLSNGTNKRNTLLNSSVTGASQTSTFATTNSSGIGLSGIVLTAATVPEPTSAMLFGVGLGGLVFRRRKKA